MTIKVCAFTSTRADFGILQNLLVQLEKDPRFELSVFITGTHLDERFGATISEIDQLGFANTYTLSVHDAEKSIQNPIDISAKVLSGLGSYLKRNTFDVILLLGDRFETASAAIAAQLSGVAIAHFHGGELTQGAIDDAFRHAITKMSAFHFPATEIYRKRIMQMGESDESVINIGSLSLEDVNELEILSRSELERNLGWQMRSKNILVTLHPETLSNAPQQVLSDQFFSALQALTSDIDDLGFIVTYPNSDPGYEHILAAIEDLKSKLGDQVMVVPSLGKTRYFSCLDCVDLLVGNTSSGMIEAASFKTPVINVGDRQKGRVSAASVFNVPYDVLEIQKLSKKLLCANPSTLDFTNPYINDKHSPSKQAIEELFRFSQNINNAVKTFVDREVL